MHDPDPDDHIDQLIAELHATAAGPSAAAGDTGRVERCCSFRARRRR
jgi:hypothetical protein